MTTHRFGNEICWNTIPSDMIVRLDDAMVHRVYQLVGSNIHGEEVLLECGARAPRDEAVATEDPVDCMGCMIRRTTAGIEAEIEWIERHWHLYEIVLP